MSGIRRDEDTARLRYASVVVVHRRRRNGAGRITLVRVRRGGAIGIDEAVGVTPRGCPAVFHLVDLIIQCVGKDVAVRTCGREGRDHCALEGCGGGTRTFRRGLGNHLMRGVLRHHAVKRGDHVRRSSGTMVMISDDVIVMTMLCIQRPHRRSVGLRRSEHGISIEGIGDGKCRWLPSIQVHRRRMIMIIVGTSAVAAPFIQLSIQKRIYSRVGIRVEDAHTIHRDGDGTAREVSGVHRNGIGGYHGVERNAPCVRSQIALRNGYLLLPCGDARHHLVFGNTERTHKEVRAVPGCRHRRTKSRKRRVDGLRIRRERLLHHHARKSARQDKQHRRTQHHDHPPLTAEHECTTDHQRQDNHACHDRSHHLHGDRLRGFPLLHGLQGSVHADISVTPRVIDGGDAGGIGIDKRTVGRGDLREVFTADPAVGGFQRHHVALHRHDGSTQGSAVRERPPVQVRMIIANFVRTHDARIQHGKQSKGKDRNKKREASKRVESCRHDNTSVRKMIVIVLNG